MSYSDTEEKARCSLSSVHPLLSIVFPISLTLYQSSFSHLRLFCFLPPIPHQVRVSISAVCRGDLSISLVSPAGTVSLLLDRRPNDASNAGLKNWTLMTVHCWGEQPQGLWTFQVREKKHFLCFYMLCCFLFEDVQLSSTGRA